MTQQEWWRYVREDRLGLILLVVAGGLIVWAVASGHLP